MVKTSFKLVCKESHDKLVKGYTYEAHQISTSFLSIMIEVDKIFSRHIYSISRENRWLFVEDWFCTLDEWRELQLKEIGIDT
jgi:hypothetical protein